MRPLLFGSLRGYKTGWLSRDVVAGLTVWAIRRHVDDDTRAVVLDAETIPFVDVSAARMLEELATDLRRDGVALVIARDIGQVRDVLRRAGADAPLVQVHRTIEDAVDAVLNPAR
jgi:MFS superfamily sulfate permease-like transporter